MPRRRRLSPDTSSSITSLLRTLHPPPSDHLLRILAREATAGCVLDLGCADGRHTEPLARLGFDLYACDAVDVEAARKRLAEVWGEEEATRRITPAKPAALGYPDEFFDWVVAHGAYDEATNAVDLTDALEETRRVLKTGGWIYVAMRRRTVGEEATSEALTRLFDEAGFVPAEPAEEAAENGERLLRGIFRKVDAGTPL